MNQQLLETASTIKDTIQGFSDLSSPTNTFNEGKKCGFESLMKQETQELEKRNSQFTKKSIRSISIMKSPMRGKSSLFQQAAKSKNNDEQFRKKQKKDQLDNLAIDLGLYFQKEVEESKHLLEQLLEIGLQDGWRVEFSPSSNCAYYHEYSKISQITHPNSKNLRLLFIEMIKRLKIQQEKQALVIKENNILQEELEQQKKNNLALEMPSSNQNEEVIIKPSKKVSRSHKSNISMISKRDQCRTNSISQNFVPKKKEDEGAYSTLFDNNSKQMEEYNQLKQTLQEQTQLFSQKLLGYPSNNTEQQPTNIEFQDLNNLLEYYKKLYTDEFSADPSTVKDHFEDTHAKDVERVVAKMADALNLPEFWEERETEKEVIYVNIVYNQQIKIHPAIEYIRLVFQNCKQESKDHHLKVHSNFMKFRDKLNRDYRINMSTLLQKRMKQQINHEEIWFNEEGEEDIQKEQIINDSPKDEQQIRTKTISNFGAFSRSKTVMMKSQSTLSQENEFDEEENQDENIQLNIEIIQKEEEETENQRINRKAFSAMSCDLEQIILLQLLNLEIPEKMYLLYAINEFLYIKQQGSMDKWEFRITDNKEYFWINLQEFKTSTVYPFFDELKNLVQIFERSVQHNEKYALFKTDLMKMFSPFRKEVDPSDIIASISNLSKEIVKEYLNLPSQPLKTLMGCMRKNQSEVQQFLKNNVLFQWPYSLTNPFKQKKYQSNQQNQGTHNPVNILDNINEYSNPSQKDYNFSSSDYEESEEEGEYEELDEKDENGEQEVEENIKKQSIKGNSNNHTSSGLEFSQSIRTQFSRVSSFVNRRASIESNLFFERKSSCDKSFSQLEERFYIDSCKNKSKVMRSKSSMKRKKSSKPSSNNLQKSQLMESQKELSQLEITSQQSQEDDQEDLDSSLTMELEKENVDKNKNQIELFEKNIDNHCNEEKQSLSFHQNLNHSSDSVESTFEQSHQLQISQLNESFHPSPPQINKQINKREQTFEFSKDSDTPPLNDQNKSNQEILNQGTAQNFSKGNIMKSNIHLQKQEIIQNQQNDEQNLLLKREEKKIEDNSFSFQASKESKEQQVKKIPQQKQDGKDIHLIKLIIPVTQLKEQQQQQDSTNQHHKIKKQISTQNLEIKKVNSKNQLNKISLLEEREKVIKEIKSNVKFKSSKKHQEQINLLTSTPKQDLNASQDIPINEQKEESKQKIRSSLYFEKQIKRVEFTPLLHQKKDKNSPNSLENKNGKSQKRFSESILEVNHYKSMSISPSQQEIESGIKIPEEKMKKIMKKLFGSNKLKKDRTHENHNLKVKPNTKDETKSVKDKEQTLSNSQKEIKVQDGNEASQIFQLTRGVAVQDTKQGGIIKKKIECYKINDDQVVIELKEEDEENDNDNSNNNNKQRKGKRDKNKMHTRLQQNKIFSDETQTVKEEQIKTGKRESIIKKDRFLWIQKMRRSIENEIKEENENEGDQQVNEHIYKKKIDEMDKKEMEQSQFEQKNSYRKWRETYLQKQKLEKKIELEADENQIHLSTLMPKKNKYILNAQQNQEQSIFNATQVQQKSYESPKQKNNPIIIKENISTKNMKAEIMDVDNQATLQNYQQLDKQTNIENGMTFPQPQNEKQKQLSQQIDRFIENNLLLKNMELKVDKSIFTRDQLRIGAAAKSNNLNSESSQKKYPVVFRLPQLIQSPRNNSITINSLRKTIGMSRSLSPKRMNNSNQSEQNEEKIMVINSEDNYTGYILQNALEKIQNNTLSFVKYNKRFFKSHELSNNVDLIFDNFSKSAKEHLESLQIKYLNERIEHIAFDILVCQLNIPKQTKKLILDSQSVMDAFIEQNKSAILQIAQCILSYDLIQQNAIKLICDPSFESKNMELIYLHVSQHCKQTFNYVSNNNSAFVNEVQEMLFQQNKSLQLLSKKQFFFLNCQLFSDYLMMESQEVSELQNDEMANYHNNINSQRKYQKGDYFQDTKSKFEEQQQFHLNLKMKRLSSTLKDPKNINLLQRLLSNQQNIEKYSVNSSLFRSITENIGKIHLVSREIILNRFECYLDTGFTPDHLIKMCLKLRVEVNKEGDLAWVCALFCLFIIKNSSQQTVSELEQFLCKNERSHFLIYFELLLELTRIRRQFAFTFLNPQNQKAYLSSLSYIKFYDYKQDTFFYYQVSTDLKKSRLSRVTINQIRQFSAIEKIKFFELIDLLGQAAKKDEIINISNAYQLPKINQSYQNTAVKVISYQKSAQNE